MEALEPNENTAKGTDVPRARCSLGQYLVNGRKCELVLDQRGLSWSRAKWHQKQQQQQHQRQVLHNNNESNYSSEKQPYEKQEKHEKQHDNKCNQENQAACPELKCDEPGDASNRKQHKHRLDFDRLINVDECHRNNIKRYKLKIYYAKQTDQKLLKLKKISIRPVEFKGIPQATSKEIATSSIGVSLAPAKACSVSVGGSLNNINLATKIISTSSNTLAVGSLATNATSSDDNKSTTTLTATDAAAAAAAASVSWLSARSNPSDALEKSDTASTITANTDSNSQSNFSSSNYTNANHCAKELEQEESLRLNSNETQLARLRHILELELDSRRRQRPSRLLVFVNPFGGKGKALSIYKSQVKRLFDLAGIDVRLVITQYANHARDTIEDDTFDLSAFEGVVCVGGDGMFSELMNGLLFRYNRRIVSRRGSSGSYLDGADESSLSTMTTTTTYATSDHISKTTAQPRQSNESSTLTELSARRYAPPGEQRFVSPPLPLGVIGAGSTDANSFGLLGTNDVSTATLNIIFGRQVQIDACSLHSIEDDDRLLRFVSTFAAYGYFGDVARESEKLRWLGPSRYDLTGISSLMKNRSYGGLVRILVSPLDGSPLDEQRCHSNCTQCISDNNELQLNYKHQHKDELKSAASLASVGRSLKKLSRKLDSCDSADSGEESVSAGADQEFGTPPVPSDTFHSDKSSYCKHQTPRDSLSGGPLKLIERRGAFIGVNAAVMACRCPQTRKGFSPSNHLANGCADLILVRPCSRLQYVNYLLRTGWSKKSAFDLKFVEAYRCRQFEFIARSSSHYYNRPGDGCDTRASASSSSRSSSSTTVDSASVCSAPSAAHSDAYSSWNVDGEVLEEPSIRVKVNNRLLRVFGTGEPQ